MAVQKGHGVTYSVDDHKTWARLFARQKKLVAKIACKEYLAGVKKLALDPKHIPDMAKTSARVAKMSGWKLRKARTPSLSMAEWFRAMNEKTFPVTDYIRKPENFDYTPMPDLFHEYTGHLPFFTDKQYAALAHRFGTLSQKANKRQLLQISRIWSLGLEFGLIKENGKLKVLGAGLLSSHGESKNALALIKKGKVVPFTLREVTATPGRTYEFHKKYFVVNSIKEVGDVLGAYAKKEALV